MLLNIIKPVYNKPIANIILNKEETETISAKSRNETGCLLSPLVFHIGLEFLARAIGQEQEIKGIQIGKEEVKLSLFAGEIILYLKDPENSTKKLLDIIINTFGKVAGYKTNTQNQ
jgi:hypothetical protein